jgi:excisionase family DNA binding protein
MPTKQMLTIPQVATALGYTRQHVYHLINSGHLVARRLTERGHFRVDSDDLAKFIETSEASTGPPV